MSKVTVSLAEEAADAATQGHTVFTCRLEQTSKGVSLAGRAGGDALPWISEQIEAIEAAGWRLAHTGSRTSTSSGGRDDLKRPRGQGVRDGD